MLQVTDWGWAESAVGVAIGAWILAWTWRLASQAVRILVQAAPASIDLDAVEADLAALAGVVDVHDLHVWTLTSDVDVASAHSGFGSGPTVTRSSTGRQVLADRHHVSHATLQVEPDDHQG